MRPLFPALLLTTSACSSEVMKSLWGGDGTSEPPVVDMLFVIDNSSSMTPESTALGLSSSSFFDAVGENMDIQMGMTTSSVYTGDGLTGGLDPGEEGMLLGNITQNNPTEGEHSLRQQLYCGATFWDRDQLPRDSEYVCGAQSDSISIEYLDCLCEDTRWDGVYGASSQEPLEAALLALCRSVDDPPESCFEGGTFSSGDTQSNIGLLREESEIVITIVGDTGDGSRRMDLGEEVPEIYRQAFAEFGRTIHFTAIGPNLTRETNAFICNTAGANYWMVERLYKMIEDSDGLYRPLEEKTGDNNCEILPFSDHMEALAGFTTSL